MAAAPKVGCHLTKLSYLLFCVAGLSGTLRAETFYLTVAGLGGEAEYEQRFGGWAGELDKILKSEPNSKVTTLAAAQATRANIQARLAEIAKDAKADDNFILMLIGHGTFDETDYKFNVPGPDVSATELAAWIDKVQAHTLVVNMTSASGGALHLLQKPKRVVITATKAGTEKNATVFTRYWIEALRDATADTDKNEVITALEAYRYAEGKTAKFFEELKRLATEHALFEDAGKGDGVKVASAESGEGLTAGRFAVLHTGSAQAMAKDPEKQKILKQKELVEQQIDELKYRKASLPLPEYRQALAKLLVELAKAQEALDK